MGWREDLAREAAEEGYQVTFGVTHKGETVMYFHETKVGTYGKKQDS